MLLEYDVSPHNFFSLLKNRDIPLRNGITGCFDWLSVTFNCFWYEPDSDFMYARLDQLSEYKFKTILSFFGRENNSLDSFERENGAEGFKYMICIQEGVTILFHGPACMNGCPSTKLNLTGRACQALIQNGKFIPLIKYCLSNGYRYTRFDAAVDNYTDLMNLEHINNLVVTRSYTSCFKKPFRITGTPNPESPYGYDGITYYLGNQADLLLRIYAKNWKEEQQELIKDWVRFEVQIRDHERIKQLLILIVLGYESGCYHNYFNIVAALLKEIVCFRVPGKDSNKSRWDIDPQWNQFLNNVESIKLFHAPKGKSEFETTENWFRKSCSLFLTQICIIYGEEKFFRYIKSLIADRYTEMRENDYNLIINEFRKKNKELDRVQVQLMMNKFFDEIDVFEFSKSVHITDEAKEYYERLEREERKG